MRFKIPFMTRLQRSRNFYLLSAQSHPHWVGKLLSVLVVAHCNFCLLICKRKLVTSEVSWACLIIIYSELVVFVSSPLCNVDRYLCRSLARVQETLVQSNFPRCTIVQFTHHDSGTRQQPADESCGTVQHNTFGSLWCVNLGIIIHVYRNDGVLVVKLTRFSQLLWQINILPG